LKAYLHVLWEGVKMVLKVTANHIMVSVQCIGLPCRALNA